MYGVMQPVVKKKNGGMIQLRPPSIGSPYNSPLRPGSEKERVPFDGG